MKTDTQLTTRISNTVANALGAFGLMLAVSFSTTANADQNWWADGGKNGSRYEHKMEHGSERDSKKIKKRHSQHNKKQDNSVTININSGHKNHKKDHHKSYSKNYNNSHKRGYDNGHSKSYKNHHSNKRHHVSHNNKKHYQNGHRKWQTVSGFRGRSGDDVTRYISVEDRVKALSIQGTKRGMYIREAHALLGNGRWIRIEGLEGYVGRGERIKHRLDKARYVQQVVLDVEPAHYKRGYAQLLVKPAQNRW